MDRVLLRHTEVNAPLFRVGRVQPATASESLMRSPWMPEPDVESR